MPLHSRIWPIILNQPAPAAYLDGVEVFNGNQVLDNRNAEALAFAQSDSRLLQLSGTDCHNPEEIGASGILLPVLPQDDKAFVQMLKDREYSLLR